MTATPTLGEDLRTLGVGAPALVGGLAGIGPWVARIQTEARKQFRRLVHVHHPDHGGDPERFKAIQVAYERVRDLRAEDVERGMAAVLRPRPIVQIRIVGTWMDGFGNTTFSWSDINSAANFGGTCVTGTGI